MSIYYVEMLDVLRSAGCRVAESSITDGWQTRARSSGGFPSPPLAVFWHHTASDTEPANDLSWMIDGSDDAPIGNLLLDRDGVFWPIAAGASNCAGKGGPSTFSRGQIPLDSGNTRGFQIEAANNGVGEAWSEAQINAYFAASNALNALVGNQPDDVISHQGWTDRKIDPATAGAVRGPWRPDSATSSGTWDLDDIRAECRARASWQPPPPEPGPTPPPEPGQPGPPIGEDEQSMVVALDQNGTAWVGDGMTRRAIGSEQVFNNYVVLGKAGAYRFVNTNGHVVSGWADVHTIGADTLEALGRIP